MTTVVSRLFPAVGRAARGLVVVVAGLNNRPQAMDPLIRVLRRAGFHALRVSLGHAPRAERPAADVIATRWVEEVVAACDVARSSHPHIPVLNLSYSLGALAVLRALEIEPTVTFSRMALLAPPLALTRGARLVGCLTPLASFGLALPSLAPAGVRARPATPLVEYAALLRLSGSVRAAGRSERLDRVPTKILVAPGDELVSARGVQSWVRRHGPSAWRVESIEVDPPRRSARHLMVSRAAIGDAAWRRLTRAVLEQFERPGQAY